MKRENISEKPNFEEPTVEIIVFSSDDVILTSPPFAEDNSDSDGKWDS